MVIIFGGTPIDPPPAEEPKCCYAFRDRLAAPAREVDGVVYPAVDHGEVHVHMSGRLGAACVHCGKPGEALCDFPLGDEGRTCDRALCLDCAPEVGANKNYCREHQEHGPGLLLFPAPKPAPAPPSAAQLGMTDAAFAAATARKEARKKARPPFSVQYKLALSEKHQPEWWHYRDCDSEEHGERICARMRREKPGVEVRIVPYAVAHARRKKSWSVKDPDHVRNGERVMLVLPPEQLHPSLMVAHEKLGMPRTSERCGVITHRQHRGGSYMIKLDGGGGLSVGAYRSDFIYPIPDGIVAFDPSRRKR